MQNKTNQANGVQYVTLVFIALVALGLGTMYVVQPDAIEVPEVNEEEIALRVAKLLEPVEGEEVVNDNSLVLDIHNKMFKEDVVESIAEELARDELESKDFRRELVDFLMDEVDVLEDMDYRDVGEFDIKNIEVLDVDGTDATVEIEFKVKVSNYGDDDEEERARLVATFDVRYLDEDDEYEDAEVNGFDIEELVRFYD